MPLRFTDVYQKDMKKVIRFVMSHLEHITTAGEASEWAGCQANELNYGGTGPDRICIINVSNLVSTAKSVHSAAHPLYNIMIADNGE